MNTSLRLSNLVTEQNLIIEKSPYSIIEKEYVGSYADLPVSDELSLIQELKTRPWKEVVKDRYFEKSPWLYKIITDSGRAQFLNILPLKPGGLYLDVGSGWGQVTLPLAQYGNSIAFDLTENRLEILMLIAEQEGKNVKRIQGNFLSFPFKDELFDLVVFNGSLEWIASGRKENHSIRNIQVAALKKTNRILKQDGMVYIGIENSLGAKYLFGANDDHTDISHLMYLSEELASQKHRKIKDSILLAKTWSLAEYKEMFYEAGFQVYKAYGCFPDYKLIRFMIDLEEINKYILNIGIQVDEHIGSNGNAFPLNKELHDLYRTLALNENAQNFCPSYGFILKKRG